MDPVARALGEGWLPAAAAAARVSGDLWLGEDAAQDACEAALAQWSRDGLPANPGGWLVTVARRRALDHLRRESVRGVKERLAVQDWATTPAATTGGADEGLSPAGDDELALLFACCHPALDLGTRVALTLRFACGLPTPTVARLLVVREPTVAQRLVRAKRKIRAAGIRLKIPDDAERAMRLAGVLKVVYLVFTEGHYPRDAALVVRDDLCTQALRLARELHRLVPGEPEVTGLLALMLLVSARAPARSDAFGALVPLAEQDRSLWSRDGIDEGLRLLSDALAAGRPGAYQVQAAIAACHAEAASAEATDWHEIAALYGRLLELEPSPVVEANRAVALAEAEGPEAGLAVLDSLAARDELTAWPQLHVARGELLARIGRRADAAEAYRTALALETAQPARHFIATRIATLDGPAHH
jgi:RNA polymerase sigma-70 factor (ECF subfamily)